MLQSYSRFCLAVALFGSLFSRPLVDFSFAQSPLQAGSYDAEIGSARKYEIKYFDTLDGRKTKTEGWLTFSVKQRNVKLNFDGQSLTSDRDAEGTSSAFVVSSDGHLLTCEHCVRHAKRIQVTLLGKKWLAKVVDSSAANDLALLKIEGTQERPLPKQLPLLRLGDSAAVRLAQDVRAIGFPLSDVLGRSVKVTRGGIAGFVGGDANGARSAPLFQIDAAVNPGNSGGPLVDGAGNVIGVVSAKLSSGQIDKVGFAVPIRAALELLKSNSVSHVASHDGAALSGPELAEQVTPAVAFVEVKTDPNRSDFIKFGVKGELEVDGKVRKVNSQVIVSANGDVVDFDDAPRLSGMCCSVVELPFIKLPEVRLNTWQQTRLISFEFDDHRRRFGDDPFGMRHPFGGFGGLGMEFDAFGHPRPRSRSGGKRNLVCDLRREFTVEQEKEPVELAADELVIAEKSTMQPFVDHDEELSVEQNYRSTWLFDSKSGSLLSRSVKGTTEINRGDGAVEIPFRLQMKLAESEGKIKSIEDFAAQDSEAKQGDAVNAFNDFPSEQPNQLTQQQLAEFLDPTKQLDRARQLKYLNRLSRWKSDEQSTKVVSTLLALAKGSDKTIRKSAIDALLHWAPNAATEAVVTELESANALSKRAWVVKLGRTNSVAAAQKLCELLSDPRTGPTANLSLRQLGPAAEPALVEHALVLMNEAAQDTTAGAKAYRALRSVFKLLRSTITAKSRQRLKAASKDRALPPAIQAELESLLK